MIREFNYTERKDIQSRHIQIELFHPEGENPASFNATLNLADLQLPDDALVVLEAERGSVSKRFEWGRAGNLCPPENRELNEVPFPPKFRVMALAVEDSRQILALNNNVKPKWDRATTSDARELVHVQEEDLGEEVWRLDFGSSDDIPVLKVNRNIDGMSNAVRTDKAFRSLVLPEVMRAILTHMVLVERADPDDTQRIWYDWFGFVGQFHAEKCPNLLEVNDEDEQAEAKQWINDAVAVFAQTRFNAGKLYAESKR